jgi:hypothetical protein
MGLFDFLFGDDSGSEEAARVMRENAAAIKDMAAKDQAARDAIISGLTPDLTYANETDKSIIEASIADASAARDRGNVTWDQYMTNVVPVQEKFFKEALDYGGLADQETRAREAVSDIRQQYGIQKGINERNLASMGVNPNSGRFAAADRAAELSAMAASAGGATKARNVARDTGIQLRKDATTIGQGLVGQTQDFGRLNIAANQLAGGLTNNAVNRGLAVGQFKVGGTANAMNALNSANSNYANALQNTDSSGLLPGLLGFGASALTAPATSWIGKKIG